LLKNVATNQNWIPYFATLIRGSLVQGVTGPRRSASMRTGSPPWSLRRRDLSPFSDWRRRVQYSLPSQTPTPPPRTLLERGFGGFCLSQAPPCAPANLRRCCCCFRGRNSSPSDGEDSGAVPRLALLLSTSVSIVAVATAYAARHVHWGHMRTPPEHAHPGGQSPSRADISGLPDGQLRDW